MIFGSHAKVSRNFIRAGHFLFSIFILRLNAIHPALTFSIQNIGYTQQITGWPDMNIDLFRRPCIGMPKAFGNKLDGDTFYIQGRGEIVPQGMRPEPWYPGMFGQTFTKPVKAVS